jgi:acetolactate synthase I/II/III large subunit
MPTQTGYRYLAEALAGYGVSHVFMVPTVAVPALAEMDEIGVEGITAHSEKAAAYMADGYARVRGGPGICMAQTIGAANLAAGLRDPFMAGSGVIAITGGTNPLTRYRHVYQEIEDFPLYEQVTKLNAYVDDVRRLPDLLRQAFREATTGHPGPVHLQLQGLSGDVLGGEIDLDTAGALVESQFAYYPAFRPRPDPDAVAAALAALAAAERPAIVAGGGVTTSGAAAEVVELARLLGIPVATSLNAKGSIAETDPLAVGVVGSYSRASANRTVSEADLVFFVGSHTGSQVTDQWRLPRPGTRVLQLDIDPVELGRNYPNAVAIHGDAKVTLRAMIEAAGSTAPSPQRQAWLDRTRSHVASWRQSAEPNLRSPQVPIRPERLCAELTEHLPDDAILLSDTGHSGIWTGSMIDLQPGQRYLRCAGSLGWALPATIGARAASPDHPVVGFTGDGGLYYHLSELETAARHGINAVIVVNDNRSLSQDMRVFQRAWGENPTAKADRMWKFEPVDLAKVAGTLGCAGYRVESPDDFGAALKDALGCGRPALIDVVTETQALPDPPYGGGDFYATA